MRPTGPGRPPADSAYRRGRRCAGILAFVALASVAAPHFARAIVSPSFLVVDPTYGPDLYCAGGCGAVLSVDLAGNATEVSDFNDPFQGPVGYTPLRIAIESARSLLAVAFGAGGERLLFRIDLASGTRT